MNKQLIFIDDSGDPGFKKGSSSNFAMAAAVFTNTDTAEFIMREIEKYRESLGWKYNHEFKFTKNPKKIVAEMLHRANNYEFKVYAVFIEKSDFREITPTVSHFINKEKLYNWMIKELLYDIPFETAKITIDGRSSRQNMRNTKTYLRREINSEKIKKLDIKFEDSAKTDLLQLADLIVGAINRSLQPDKADAKEYISIIQDKIVKIRKITIR